MWIADKLEFTKKSIFVLHLKPLKNKAAQNLGFLELENCLLLSQKLLSQPHGGYCIESVAL